MAKRFRKPQWISQIADSYRMTRPVDPSIRFILPLVFIVVTGTFVGVGTLLGGLWITLSVTSWAWGLLATLYVFGRRAELAAYKTIEGQPGAAAQVLMTMRGGWFTTMAVEVNKQQEVVHRLVGRPGVMLIIEANPGSQIASVAKSKTARWVGETPIREIWVGNNEGQVPLAKLTRYVKKLPKVLRPAEVTELRRKLDAAAGGSLPIPKGPIPKNLKIPRR